MPIEIDVLDVGVATQSANELYAPYFDEETIKLLNSWRDLEIEILNATDDLELLRKLVLYDPIRIFIGSNGQKIRVDKRLETISNNGVIFAFAPNDTIPVTEIELDGIKDHMQLRQYILYLLRFAVKTTYTPCIGGKYAYNKPIISMPDISDKVQHFLRELNAIYKMNIIVPNYRHILWVMGIYDIFERILNGKSETKAIDVLRIEQAHKQFNKKLRFIEMEKEKRIIQLFTLAKQLFPKKTANIRYNEDALRETLTKSEWDLLNKKLNVPDKKPCKHFEIVSRFEDTIEYDSKMAQLSNILREFSKSKPAAGSMYMCKICNQDLICPHIVDQLNVKGASLEIETVLSKYMTPPIDGRYYCNICSEFLIESAEMTVNDDDKTWESLSIFYKYVWRIANQMLSYVYFENVFRKDAFLDALMDLCYPILEIINRKLQKQKEDKYVPFNIASYCLMYIYKTIEDTKFNGSVMFKGVKGKVKEMPALCIKEIYSILKNNNFITDDTTNEEIKAKLLKEAYPIIRSRYVVSMNDFYLDENKEFIEYLTHIYQSMPYRAAQ